MTGLLAAGTSCRFSGGAAHPVRRWWLDADRLLHWTDESGSDNAKVPLPSDAPVLIVDPWRGIVVHTDGSTWWRDVRGGSPRWRPGFRLTEGDNVKNFLGACWASCSTGAAWDAERKVWTWQRDSMSPAALLSPHPVPGEAAILSVSIGPPTTVVLADGTRLLLSGSAWLPIGGLIGATTTSGAGEGKLMRLKATRGMGRGEGHSVAAGELFDAPESEGMALIRTGRAELAAEPIA